jgi:Protein of unknown function (DUF1501)
VAENPAYCYDAHATMLHLLGIDHKRLTYRHNGIDRRITDIVSELIVACWRDAPSVRRRC